MQYIFSILDANPEWLDAVESSAQKRLILRGTGRLNCVFHSSYYVNSILCWAVPGETNGKQTTTHVQVKTHTYTFLVMSLCPTIYEISEITSIL